MGMNRTCRHVALLSALAVAGCGKPFAYGTATPEERRAFLESSSQGLYDGLAKTLPHGTGGVYATMGERRIDPERKLIEITVDVTDGGENITSSDSDKEKMLSAICREYRGSLLDRNGITISFEFDLPGGGTALSFEISRDNCSHS
jgi:hypothetical protein